MASTLSWLDHSERQRRRMLEIVGLFREQGTVDELGLGTIRDALADRFFPGTSTLHTRYRYLLFVPWLYQMLESTRVAAEQVDHRLRALEVRLIGALEQGGAGQGVIGIDARHRLQRPPSTIYWASLATFGIRRFPGSQQQYHRSFAALRRSAQVRTTDEDGPGDESLRAWHAGLPQAPAGLLDSQTFALTREEAQYLQERILRHAGDTALGFLVTREGEVPDGDLPWQCSLFAHAPPTLRHHLDHGRCFSELLHGASLMYNLLLADKAAAHRDLAADTDAEDLRERYRQRLDHWRQMVAADLDRYAEWSLVEFSGLVREVNPRASPRAMRFTERWVQQVLEHRGDVADVAEARRLVEEREVAVKGRLARTRNLRALERWSGASGVDQLSFRWRQARGFAHDVLDGLAG